MTKKKATKKAAAAAAEAVIVPVPLHAQEQKPPPAPLSSNVARVLDRALRVFTHVKKKPREIQVEAMRRCIESYENGAEFVVLEAPPGVGKSLIGVGLATAYGNRAYFTTLTAQLQEQYMNEFSPLGMRVLKGRGKYDCRRAGESCAVGKEVYKDDDACYGPPDPMMKDPTLPADSAACPYLFAKQSAFNAQLMMANYHSFLANIGQAAQYGGGSISKREERALDEVLEGLAGKLRAIEALELGATTEGERAAAVAAMERVEAAMAERMAVAAAAKGDDAPLVEDDGSTRRPFMVLDEAHIIESFLLDQTGVSINLRRLGFRTDPLPTVEDKLEPYMVWMKSIMPQLRMREKVLNDAQEKEELRSLIRRIGFVLSKFSSGNSDYVIERDRDEEGDLKPDFFAVKPLRVHEYGHWLWGHGKRALLMSATVLDAYQLCTNIGLPIDKGDFVQMGSVFPKENRPIKVTPLDMRHSAKEYSWPRAAQLVDNLMNWHQREKGLLLCPSNAMLKFIADNVSKMNRMRLIFATGRDREQKYNEHKLGRTPSVLAASGYWEGADLAGDASRFQIIPACPRPMWHGQIKARAKLDPAWYRWLTYCKLVQGYGRSIRSETDEAITYIFDKEFVDEMNRSSGSMIPPWMKEAVSVTGQEKAA